MELLAVDPKVDGLDLLAAVVWPGPKLLAASLAAVEEKKDAA